MIETSEKSCNESRQYIKRNDTLGHIIPLGFNVSMIDLLSDVDKTYSILACKISNELMILALPIFGEQTKT